MPALDRQQKGDSRAPLAGRLHSLTRRSHSRGRGFSLIELVIVVVIVGLLAAIAIPRFSSAGDSATDAAFSADLETLRKAIELYQGEHLGTYPDAARIANQLTQYTDIHGNPSPTKTSTHTYGPYVRAIPPLKVGPNRGCTKVAATTGNDVGWIYDQASGQVTAAAPVNDRRGKPYGEY